MEPPMYIQTVSSNFVKANSDGISTFKDAMSLSPNKRATILGQCSKIPCKNSESANIHRKSK